MQGLCTEKNLAQISAQILDHRFRKSCFFSSPLLRRKAVGGNEPGEKPVALVKVIRNPGFPKHAGGQARKGQAKKRKSLFKLRNGTLFSKLMLVEGT